MSELQAVQVAGKETRKQEFRRLSEAVKRAQKQMLVGVDIMLDIRDRKLWGEEYSSWNECCEKEWGWSRRWTNDQILTHQTERELQEAVNSHFEVGGMPPTFSKENKGNQVVLSSRQREKLDGFTTSVKLEIIQKATESAGGKPLTPAIMDAVKKELKGGDAKTQSKPAPVMVDARELDELGYPIPMEIMEIWRRRDEIHGLIKGLKVVRLATSKAEGDLETEGGTKKPDVMFAEVNFQTVRAGLKNAETSLTRAIPYAVCAACQGIRPSHCSACQRRGFVSKFFWDHCVPEEIKVLRMKQIKAHQNSK